MTFLLYFNLYFAISQFYTPALRDSGTPHSVTPHSGTPHSAFSTKPFVSMVASQPRTIRLVFFTLFLTCHGFISVCIVFRRSPLLSAWMTSDLLHKIFSKLNRFFRARNRSILLFLDSAGFHPYDLKGRYSNIKLVFFSSELHIRAAASRFGNNS